MRRLQDEHSGQFSWETSSQLEMNLSDLDTATTPAVPRKSSESTGGATSPNGGVGGGAKPTPIRKARLVENWLDSPVLKAMQVCPVPYPDALTTSETISPMYEYGFLSPIPDPALPLDLNWKKKHCTFFLQLMILQGNLTSK